MALESVITKVKDVYKRQRLYQIKVVSDVPIEPARVRRKLNKLDAEAIFSGGKPERVMVVSRCV